MRAGSPRPVTTTSVTESLPGPSIPVGANRSWGTTAAIGLIPQGRRFKSRPATRKTLAFEGSRRFGESVISFNAATLPQADSSLRLTGEVPRLPPSLIHLSGEPPIVPWGDDGSGVVP